MLASGCLYHAFQPFFFQPHRNPQTFIILHLTSLALSINVLMTCNWKVSCFMCWSWGNALCCRVNLFVLSNSYFVPWWASSYYVCFTLCLISQDPDSRGWLHPSSRFWFRLCCCVLCTTLLCPVSRHTCLTSSPCKSANAGASPLPRHLFPQFPDSK